MKENDPRLEAPYDVECSHCGAKAWRWCKRPSGHSGPFVAPHASRVKSSAALEVANTPWPDRLRALRKRRNWTQQKFAEVMLVARTTIISWEQGETEPRGIHARWIEILEEQK